MKVGKELKTYRAMARGYMDGAIVEPGQVFSTRATQGSWMEPIEDVSALRKLAAESGVANAQSVPEEALVSAINGAVEHDRPVGFGARE